MRGALLAFAFGLGAAMAAMAAPAAGQTVVDTLKDLFFPAAKAVYTVGPVQPAPDSDLTIDILTRRLKALDARPGIVQQGSALIVTVRAADDDTAIRSALIRRGAFAIHLVEAVVPTCDGLDLSGRACLPDVLEPGRFYVVETPAEIAGDVISDAEAVLDQVDRPALTLRLTADAARRFGQLTRRALGQMAAVVLDGTVMTAPLIQTPILGGSLMISGGTMAENRVLAAILAQPALPEQLTIYAVEIQDPQR